MNFYNVSIVFWVLSLSTFWAWKRSLEAFKQKLKVSVPELWENFKKPSEAYAHTSPDQQLQEYIWKRDYLELEDIDLIRKGNATRFYHVIFGINATFLLFCYVGPFVFPHI